MSMAGPGGKEVGRVSIRVLPDTSAFRRSLDRYLERVERSTRIRIPAELDDKNVARDARRVANNAEKLAKVNLPTGLNTRALRTRVRALAKQLSGHDIVYNVRLDRRSIAHAYSAISTLGRALRMFVIPAALTSLVPALGGITIAATQAAGAINLLPGALAGAAIGLGAVIIGMQGFGTALKDMGDPAKFAEALAKLAPSAREAAIAIKELGPAWRTLQLDVQQRLFEGIGQTITELGTVYLPILQRGLADTAGAIAAMGRYSGRALMRPESIAAVNTMLEQTAQAFRNARTSLGDFLRGFVQVGAVGSTYLPRLANWVSDVGRRFAEWSTAAAQSGRLNEIIDASIAALSQMGRIIGNVASALGGLFAAAGASGFMGALETATARLDAFIHSARGMTGLKQIFAGFNAALRGIGEAFSDVFEAMVVHLGPVIAELGPAVGQLARQIGTALVTAIRVAAPILQVMARFLRENMTWLGPIIIMFGTFIGTLMMLTKVVTFISSLATGFQLLSLAVSGASKFLLGVPGTLTRVGTAFAALGTRIATGAAIIGSRLLLLGQQFAMMVVRATVATAQVIARFAIMAAQTVARLTVMAVQVAVQFTVMAAQAVARVTMMALTVTAQFAAMVARAVASMAMMAARVVAQWAIMAAGAMARAAIMAAAWLVAMGPVGWVIAAVVGLVALIIANWDRVKAFTISAWTAVANFVSNAWNRISSAVSNGVSQAVSFMASLPGRILGAIGNLGSLLWSAGADLVRGMINGVRSMIGNLLGTVRNMAQQAVAGVKSWLGIGSPSKVFAQLGGWTSEGFAKGIRQAAPEAINAAADMANAVARTPTASMAAPSVTGTSPSRDMQQAVTAGVFAALHEARMRVEGDGVAKLVNRTNAVNARR